MPQSSSEFLKSLDNKAKEENPWLPEFNYDETVTPESIFDKLKNATHKINPKRALDMILSNRNSKFNSFNKAEQSPTVSDPLEVANIATNEQKVAKENIDDISKE